MRRSSRALTTRVGRRALLLLALAAFVAGNAVAAVASNFDLLLLARALTGSVHGVFIGVASVLAAGLVPAERRGQAISMVFGGIALSTVLGVPAGTLLGQSLGWHAAFVVVVALGVVAPGGLGRGRAQGRDGPPQGCVPRLRERSRRGWWPCWRSAY